jgi:hypothetical protein
LAAVGAAAPCGSLTLSKGRLAVPHSQTALTLCALWCAAVLRKKTLATTAALKFG